jgi:ATP-dependent DNA helicase RecG
MRELKLRDPIIEQRDNSVVVTLRHERLGASEDIITRFLKEHDEINNTTARELCFIGDANKMKRIFQKMMQAGLIERIEGRAQNKAAYRKGRNFPRE